MGPATGIPSPCRPQRPRSWIVVSMPGRTTVSPEEWSTFKGRETPSRFAVEAREVGLGDWTKAHLIAGLQERRLSSSRVERPERRATDDVPAARRDVRIDAGLP